MGGRRLLLAAAGAAAALAAPASAGRFWTSWDIPRWTDVNEMDMVVPPRRFEPGWASCQMLELALLVGGYDMEMEDSGPNNTETFRNDVYIFEGATELWAKPEFELGNLDDIPRRRGWNIASVEPHFEQDSNKTCRFVLSGGSAGYNFESSSDVFILEVTRHERPGPGGDGAGEENGDQDDDDEDDDDEEEGEKQVKTTAFLYTVRFARISVTNDSWPSGNVLGRVEGGAFGYKNHMFVNKGQTYRSLWESDTWRLSIFDLGAPNCPNVTDFDLTFDDEMLTFGVWNRVGDEYVSGYQFGSGVVLGQHFLTFGGLSTDSSRTVARAAVSAASLEDLANMPGLPVSSLNSPFKEVPLDETRLVYRYNHRAVGYKNYMFNYGGRRLIVPQSNRLVGNHQVEHDVITLTSYNPTSNTVSCRNKEGGQVDWCAFQEEFPYDTTRFVLTSIGRFMYVYVHNRTADVNRIHRLDMESVIANGRASFKSSFVDDQEELDYFNAFLALQYALIAICLALIMSLLYVYKREEPMGPSLLGPLKSTGVSLEVIRSLDYVKFVPNGRHIPVLLEWDEEGSPSITEELDPDDLQREIEAKKNAEEDEKDGAESISGQDEDDDGEDEDGASKRKKAGDGNAPAAPAPAQDHIAAYYGASDDGDMCAICICEFEEDEIDVLLPCHHLFHWECVEPWLLKNGTCPQCRKHVVTGEYVVDDKRDITPSEAEEEAQRAGQDLEAGRGENGENDVDRAADEAEGAAREADGAAAARVRNRFSIGRRVDFGRAMIGRGMTSGRNLVGRGVASSRNLLSRTGGAGGRGARGGSSNGEPQLGYDPRTPSTRTSAVTVSSGEHLNAVPQERLSVPQERPRASSQLSM